MNRAPGPLADIPRVNRIFTLLCFAVPPAAGSLVSLLFNGGSLGCTYNVARGRVRLSDVREVRIMSMLFLAYVGVSILAALVNGSAFLKPLALLSLLTFAFFPFSYAYWSVSRKTEIVSSAVWGAAIACASGLAVALVQVLLYPESRAEGGAGNALVFATVMSIATTTVIAGMILMETRRLPLLWASAACGVLALMLSQSRAPALVFAFNAALLVLVFGRGSWVRPFWFSMAGLAALFSVLFAAGVQMPFFALRFDDLAHNWAMIRDDGNYRSSAGMRFAIWQIGLDVAREAPWFGHGRGAAAAELTRRLLDGYGIRRSFTHFHNALMQALVQNGILGLLSLLSLLGYGFWLAVATIRSTTDRQRLFGAALLLIVLMTYTGCGMTNIMFGHDILDAVFMVCMVPGTYLAVGRSMAEPAGDAAREGRLSSAGQSGPPP